MVLLPTPWRSFAEVEPTTDYVVMASHFTVALVPQRSVVSPVDCGRVPTTGSERGTDRVLTARPTVLEALLHALGLAHAARSQCVRALAAPRRRDDRVAAAHGTNDIRGLARP